MKIIPKISYSGLLLLGFLTGGLASLNSCATEDEIADIAAGSDHKIRVGAAINAEKASRAEVYVAQGEITTGMYYLTYQSYGNPSFSVATVNFDVTDAEGNGIVTDPSGKELAWKNVRTFNNTNNQRANFYLDNVSPSGSDALIIQSQEFQDTYKAAVLDTITGSNDLLAGSLLSVDYDTEKLDFNLSHQLSRLKLVISVNNIYDEGQADFVNLSNAQITLSNICCDVVSYDRSNQTLTNSNTLSDLQIVDTSNENLGWVWPTGLENAIVEADNSTTQYYISQSMVIPPQTVNQITNRPILTITTTGDNPRSFWGYLPASMIDEGTNTSQVTSFQFLKGYLMTLRVHVNAAERMLIFQPVTIENWVDVGNQRLNGSEEPATPETED